jgi:hypothetical protein
MSDIVECKICYQDFKSIENQGICDDCQKKILKSLGVELTEDWNVVKEEHNELRTFVYKVSELFGLVDYNYHGIKNHTHGTKTVNTVDIE